jgi:hypothetical protein
MLDAEYFILDKKENSMSYPASIIYSFRAPKSGKKPWPRLGFARLELKDSGWKILQRSKCSPGKLHQGGLATNVKKAFYEDVQPRSISHLGSASFSPVLFIASFAKWKAF